MASLGNLKKVFWLWKDDNLILAVESVRTPTLDWILHIIFVHHIRFTTFSFIFLEISSHNKISRFGFMLGINVNDPKISVNSEMPIYKHVYKHFKTMQVACRLKNSAVEILDSAHLYRVILEIFKSLNRHNDRWNEFYYISCT